VITACGHKYRLGEDDNDGEALELPVGTGKFTSKLPLLVIMGISLPLRHACD